MPNDDTEINTMCKDFEEYIKLVQTDPARALMVVTVRENADQTRIEQGFVSFLNMSDNAAFGMINMVAGSIMQKTRNFCSTPDGGMCEECQRIHDTARKIYNLACNKPLDDTTPIPGIIDPGDPDDTALLAADPPSRHLH